MDQGNGRTVAALGLANFIHHIEAAGRGGEESGDRIELADLAIEEIHNQHRKYNTDDEKGEPAAPSAHRGPGVCRKAAAEHHAEDGSHDFAQCAVDCKVEAA